MEISVERKELFEAFGKAQGDIQDVIRDTSSYKGKYAKLEQVVQEIRRVLVKYGLSFTQLPGGVVDNVLMVENAVFHKSGQHFSHTMEMPIGKCPNGISEAQHIGMVISYARRYGLLSMFGMAQEDDDAALVPVRDNNKSKPSSNVIPKSVLGSSHKVLRNMIKNYGITEEVVGKWKVNYKVESLAHLTDEEVDGLIEMVKMKYENYALAEAVS